MEAWHCDCKGIVNPIVVQCFRYLCNVFVGPDLGGQSVLNKKLFLWPQGITNLSVILKNVSTF